MRFPDVKPAPLAELHRLVIILRDSWLLELISHSYLWPNRTPGRLIVFHQLPDVPCQRVSLHSHRHDIIPAPPAHPNVLKLDS